MIGFIYKWLKNAVFRRMCCSLCSRAVAAAAGALKRPFYQVLAQAVIFAKTGSGQPQAATLAAAVAGCYVRALVAVVESLSEAIWRCRSSSQIPTQVRKTAHLF